MTYVIDKGEFIFIPTEKHYSDYFISGTGYLCCKNPHRLIVSENPLMDWGVTNTKQIDGVVEENDEYFVKIRIRGGYTVKLSEMIKKLEDFKNEFGDISVVVRKDDSYWGSIDNYIDEYNLYHTRNSQPNGHKSEEWGEAIVFDSNP